jgi:hypothetical protein
MPKYNIKAVYEAMNFFDKLIDFIKNRSYYDIKGASIVIYINSDLKSSI